MDLGDELGSALPVLNLLLGDAAIEQRSCQWDVGMVQADALGVDCAATLRALDELEQRLPALIEAEALWLASQGQPVLIIGDIPRPQPPWPSASMHPWCG